jgi:hypothetical protein
VYPAVHTDTFQISTHAHDLLVCAGLLDEVTGVARAAEALKAFMWPGAVPIVFFKHPTNDIRLCQFRV